MLWVFNVVFKDVFDKVGVLLVVLGMVLWIFVVFEEWMMWVVLDEGKVILVVGELFVVVLV